MPANSVFDGPVTNLLSVLCILIEVLSRAHEKGEGVWGGVLGGGGEGGTLMTSNSAILLVISRMAGAASKAGKGLSAAHRAKNHASLIALRPINVVNS